MRRDSEDWHFMRRGSSDQHMIHREASYHDELASSASSDLVWRRSIGKHLAALPQTASRLVLPLALLFEYSLLDCCIRRRVVVHNIWPPREGVETPWRAISHCLALASREPKTKRGRRESCSLRRACLSSETKVAQLCGESPFETLPSSACGGHQAEEKKLASAIGCN